MIIFAVKNENGQYRTSFWDWGDDVWDVWGAVRYYTDRSKAEEVAKHIQKTEKVKCKAVAVEIKEVNCQNDNKPKTEENHD